MADTPHGTTIAFGTSSFSANLLSISGPDLTRASYKTSHLGTTGGYHTYDMADLVEGGDITVEFEFDGDDDPPIDGATETVTITWPNSYTWAATCGCSGYSVSATDQDDRMTASMALKVCGAVTMSSG